VARAIFSRALRGVLAVEFLLETFEIDDVAHDDCNPPLGRDPYAQP
jgi:hypothetical protein